MKDDRTLVMKQALDISLSYSRESEPKIMQEEQQTKMLIYGAETIEKVVAQNGNSGRVYLPIGWKGHRVKIVRID